MSPKPKPRAVTASEEEVIRARARDKRRRKYTTRRQRLRQHLKAWRLAFLAIGLALLAVVIFNWRDIYTYVRFSLMD